MDCKDVEPSFKMCMHNMENGAPLENNDGWNGNGRDIYSKEKF